jgi:hypothetical protein
MGWLYVTRKTKRKELQGFSSSKLIVFNGLQGRRQNNPARRNPGETGAVKGGVNERAETGNEIFRLGEPTLRQFFVICKQMLSLARGLSKSRRRLARN